MMRSMFSGISGLRIHQTKMDVIGNNIANVNTTAFKASRVTFNEVFSQTLQGASGASAQTGRGGRNPMQVGLGANIASVDTLMTTGAAQRTDNPFDLMINGDGFFVVGDESGTYFTRAGAFRKDDEGNLVIPNGMKVKGWPAADDGTRIQRGAVVDIKLDNPENLTAAPAATTNLRIEGNVNLADGGNFATEEGGIPIQLKFYDTLGNLYSTNLTMRYDSTDTEKNWKIDIPDTLTLTDSAGNEYTLSNVGSVEGDPVVIEFDENGNLNKTNSSGNGIFTISQNGTADAEFDLSEDITAGNPVKAHLGPLTVDFSGLTQYNQKTNVDPLMGDANGLGAGREPGELTGYNIGADGIIIGQYSNGQQKMLGQVVIANFRNPAGLQKVGDNLFTTTPNSGEFDGIGEEPDLQGGVLEMSNVDLAKEFTEMITTQRGFQANSRIITSSDEMLQELVNLKR
ncbi:flagellar hook protein FlgE [Defluviitalea saccharophila]|uniref:Flagellar hook protein FlgE n=1 Tax=Defluviitalea saccharophila TaxID=879970 RepID=A0ABZ2Y4I9_9FIRM